MTKLSDKLKALAKTKKIPLLKSLKEELSKHITRAAGAGYSSFRWDSWRPLSDSRIRDRLSRWAEEEGLGLHFHHYVDFEQCSHWDIEIWWS